MACGGNIAARLVSKAVLRLQRKGQSTHDRHLRCVPCDACRSSARPAQAVDPARKNTGTNQFRQLVRELALFDGYEAMRDLPMEDVEVETPITTATFKQLAGKKLAIVPILRAGLGMVDGILDLVPSARVGHIGMERDEVTHEPHEYYCKMPKDIDQRICLVVDPMLATGGSAEMAISYLRERGVKDIRMLCIVAAPEGLKSLTEKDPDVHIYTCAIDDHLNEAAYIVPGLGDAGDRIFGTL